MQDYSKAQEVAVYHLQCMPWRSNHTCQVSILEQHLHLIRALDHPSCTNRLRTHTWLQEYMSSADLSSELVCFGSIILHMEVTA